MATSVEVAPHRRSSSKPHGHHGHHHKKKQRSLLPSWITWESVNLGLTFVGSIVSLTGVFVVWAGTYNPSQIFTDAGLNHVLETSAVYQASGLASAVIAVPACIDALFDFYVIVKTWGTEEQRLQSKQGHIEHMSVFERLLFCAGMFSSLMSVFPYLPAPYLRVIYYINYSSINAILLICPIMIFLSRVNKKMWNDTMAFTIVCFVVVAALVQTASTLFPETSSIGNNLSTISSLAMYMALGIYTFTFVVQMLRINYVRTKARQQKAAHAGRTNHKSSTTTEGTGGSRSTSGQAGPAAGSDEEGDLEEDELEQSINFDTALAHTCNMFALLILNVIWYQFPVPGEVMATVFNFVNMAVSCSVLVVEMRVRKKEISRGMSQLDSKRAFVRYISHEMRTPLSAAAMGLSLLEDDIEQEDFVDTKLHGTFLQRHGEVLCMVQDSFKKAETICADVLQYDKYENDNVPLYPETYPAAELLHDIVQPFHVLARQAEVTLTVNAFTNRHVPLAELLLPPDEVEHARRMSAASGALVTAKQKQANREADALLLDALVDADKPKLTQVVSNLLSNAFKFTPKGNAVTVTLHLSTVLGAKATKQLLDGDSGKGRAKMSAKAPAHARQEGLLRQLLPREARRFIQYRRYRQQVLRGLASRVRYTLFGDLFGDLDTELERLARRDQRAERARHDDGDEDGGDDSDAEDDLYDDGTYLVVSVTDSGVGIAKEDVPKMFKSIVQFNPNELQGGGGAGLGMVLSRGIVERHAGKMWLHSEGVGLGSTFAFGVPLSKRKEPTADPQTGLPLEEHPEDGASGGWVRKKPNGQRRRRGDRGSTLTGLADEGVARQESATFVDIDPSSSTPVGARTLPVEGSMRTEQSAGPDNKEGEAGGGGGGVVSVVSMRPFEQPAAWQSATRRSTLDGGNDNHHDHDRDHDSDSDASEKNDVSPEPMPAPAGPFRARKNSLAAPRPVGEPPKRVLIAEDDPACRKMLVRVLQKLNFEVEEAEDGAQSAEIMQAALDGRDGKRPFDLVLSDFVMPNMDGPTSVAAIRDGGYTGPIFGVTDNQLQSDIEHFIAKGADKIMAKPLKLPELRKALEAFDDPLTSSRSPSQSPSQSSASTWTHTPVDTSRSPVAVSRSTLSSAAPSAKDAAGPKRVLIAEDDAVCRKMLARVLKGLNYEVAEAEDGAVALAMMRASTKSDDGTGHPFDLVLSDYTMPNMEGPESVAGMREAGYTGPIFGVTGNQLQADIDLFIAKGADKVIAKPLKLPALKQAIQEYEGHGATTTTTTTVLTSRRATTMAVSNKGGAGKATASPAAAPSAKDASGLLRVLIAEDDAVCRKMLARVLKSMNYEVAEAEDGAVALEMMRASMSDDGTGHPFDLVLSDFTMPNMDGPESVGKMREAGYTGPIFGVTGNQLQADIDLFIAKGADKVIAKPLKLPALKQAIQEYKEQRRVTGMLMLQSY